MFACKLKSLFRISCSIVHGAMSCSQKKLYASLRCIQLLSGFLAIDHLPLMSRESRLSDNCKSDNGVKLGTVQRSADFYLTAQENPGNPQLWDRPIKTVPPVIAWNGGPYLQMTGRIAQHIFVGERKRAGGRNRKEEYILSCYKLKLTCCIKRLVLRRVLWKLISLQNAIE